MGVPISFVVTRLCARSQTGGFQVYFHHYFLFVVFVFEVLFIFLNEKLDEIRFRGKGDNGSNATVHGSSIILHTRAVRGWQENYLSPT